MINIMKTKMNEGHPFLIILKEVLVKVGVDSPANQLSRTTDMIKVTK